MGLESFKSVRFLFFSGRLGGWLVVTCYPKSTYEGLKSWSGILLGAGLRMDVEALSYWVGGFVNRVRTGM